MSIQAFTSKLPAVDTTIFTTMSQLANQHQAINLSQGFPDYAINPHLASLLIQHISGDNHQYAPMIGVDTLRFQIQQMLYQLYAANYDMDTEITVHSGASEAIFASIAALVHIGDEVIIFEPAYDLYAPIITLFGGIPIPIRTAAPDFSIDWDDVKTRFSSKTILIILNNPNNPTGKVYSHSDLNVLATIVADTNAYILSDEVYANIVYTPSKFTSVCEIEALQSRSIIVGSFGKLLHTTGWKVGYSVAPAVLMREIRKVHQFNTFCVNQAFQLAIADYIKDKHTYTSLPDFFKTKQDYLFDAFTQLGLSPTRSEGTYFMLISPPNPDQLDDFKLAKYYLEHHKVAFIPINAFYTDERNTGILRVCFAKRQETLEASVINLSTQRK